MMEMGSWWFKSKKDPRWNYDGRGFVGMLGSYNDLPDSKNKMKELKKKFGIPPKDLEFGYMKD